MLLKSHTLEFLLDAAKKNIKMVLCHFMPLIIGSGQEGFSNSKTGSPIFYICLTSPFMRGGGRYQTNVNKGQVEEEDYLSYSKKTYLNQYIMIFLLVIKEN